MTCGPCSTKWSPQNKDPEDELWLAFGTGKSLQYRAAHEISAALPEFHALTGCDTVSSFAGRGKQTAWAVLAVFPELTNCLLELSSAPHYILQEVMATIESFIILLYDRTSTSTDIDQARRKLFAKRHNVQSIPPAKAALKEHVKRAVYNKEAIYGVRCWCQHEASEGHYEPLSYLSPANVRRVVSSSVSATMLLWTAVTLKGLLKVFHD